MRHDGSLPPPLILTLPSFVGTLEELVALVRSGACSITSLPLSRITSAVLTWVCELRSHWKMDSADVVEVAAALIRMKSRSLLPAPPPQSPLPTAGSDESPNLFEELEALRTTIQHLREMWMPVRSSSLEGLLSEAEPPEAEQAQAHTGLDLIRSLEQALHLIRSVPPPLYYDREPFPLHELSQLILASCADARAQNRGCLLNELLAAQTAAAPGLFLAALELVRNKQLVLIQGEVFGAIQLEERPAPESD